MISTILSVGAGRSRRLPNPSIEESSRMTNFVLFFKTTNMEQLVARQSMFISMLTGGRVVYTGQDIRAAHAQAREQGLNDGHFDWFLEHFREALHEVGVEAYKVERVIRLLETKRNAVLDP